MLRVLIVAAVMMVTVAHAAADTVALLPLDGEKRLEIYGQPVAAEIGRALQAEGIDVVVVGAKMNVPERAQLIVDGTIKADKKNAITLEIRIRDPKQGTVLETLPASAATLTTIDKAAAELSAKVVPAVKTHVAALARPQVETPRPPAVPPPDTHADTRPPSPRPAAIATRVTSKRPSPVLDLLAGALRDESTSWSQSHAGTAARGADLALEIVAFDVTPGEVPLARARVHARIRINGEVRFDRIIRTDTVVGDKRIADAALAARTAREVLAIVNAQLRRLVSGWR